MTNMSKKELKRIVDQKLSPLYISVHATDVDLRRKLLLYKWGKDDFLLKKVKYLIDNGIELHGQIVLIPNMNDGKHLKKTASDIYEFFPKFKTLSRDIWIKTIGASPKIAVKIAAMNVKASKPLKRYSSGINQVQSKIRSWDAMPVSLEIR